eukprot:Clim_evm27s134 gene=Clim_evmTU27s134
MDAETATTDSGLAARSATTVSRDSQPTNGSSGQSNPLAGVLHKDDANSFILEYKALSMTDELGRGSFGVVFEGMYFGSPVAIKQLVHMPKDLLADFRREVSVMKRLRHPNIMLFIGATVSPDPLCIVTELCEKGSLQSVMDKEVTTIDYKRRLRMLLDVGRGMNYLHHAGIIHLDLKPSNILVGRDDTCKVADFGLSKILSYKATSMTNQGGGGTVLYTAPEVFRGDRINTKADIYSFAVTMWHLYSLKQPYLGVHMHAVCFNVVAQHKRPEIPRNCETPYAELIIECWAPAASKRPTFDEIIKKLEDLYSAGGAEVQRYGLSGVKDRAGSAKDISDDPRLWSKADVKNWLVAAGFDDVVEVFEENEINGKVLLSLRDEDLKRGLGIQSFGRRRELLLGISTLCRLLENNAAQDPTDVGPGRFGDPANVMSENLALMSGGITRLERNGTFIHMIKRHKFTLKRADAATLNSVNSTCAMCDGQTIANAPIYECQNCGIMCHRQCFKLVDQDCQSAASWISSSGSRAPNQQHLPALILGRLLLPIRKSQLYLNKGDFETVYTLYRRAAEEAITLCGRSRANTGSTMSSMSSTTSGMARLGLNQVGRRDSAYYSTRMQQDSTLPTVLEVKVSLALADCENYESTEAKCWVIRRSFDYLLNREEVIALPQAEEIFLFTVEEVDEGDIGTFVAINPKEDTGESQPKNGSNINPRGLIPSLTVRTP